MKKIPLLLGMLLMFAGIVLTGCGKMSPPEAYEGSGYPHSYPRR